MNNPLFSKDDTIAQQKWPAILWREYVTAINPLKACRCFHPIGKFELDIHTEFDQLFRIRQKRGHKHQLNATALIDYDGNAEPAAFCLLPSLMIAIAKQTAPMWR